MCNLTLWLSSFDVVHNSIALNTHSPTYLGRRYIKQTAAKSCEARSDVKVVLAGAHVDFSFLFFAVSYIVECRKKLLRGRALRITQACVNRY